MPRYVRFDRRHRHQLATGGLLTGALLTGALLIALTAGCTGDPDGPVTVQPGAPGESGREVTGEDLPRPDDSHTVTDVHFLHGMIVHHQQALRMTGLVADRSDRDDLPLLARRMEISQEDEIAVMESWLEIRGEPLTGEHDPAMPGMLSESQLVALEQATGAEFDRLFLELMIEHHEGAVIMVEDLLAAGGGQEPELFALISHIDSDQRIEISRMRRMLAESD